MEPGPPALRTPSLSQRTPGECCSVFIDASNLVGSTFLLWSVHLYFFISNAFILQGHKDKFTSYFSNSWHFECWTKAFNSFIMYGILMLKMFYNNLSQKNILCSALFLCIHAVMALSYIICLYKHAALSNLWFSICKFLCLFHCPKLGNALVIQRRTSFSTCSILPSLFSLFHVNFSLLSSNFMKIPIVILFCAALNS